MCENLGGDRVEKIGIGMYFIVLGNIRMSRDKYENVLLVIYSFLD